MVKTWFESSLARGFKGIEHSYEQRVETGHQPFGRLRPRRENHQIWAVPLTEMGELYQSGQWAGLKTV